MYCGLVHPFTSYCFLITYPISSFKLMFVFSNVCRPSLTICWACCIWANDQYFYFHCRHNKAFYLHYLIKSFFTFLKCLLQFSALHLQTYSGSDLFEAKQRRSTLNTHRRCLKILPQHLAWWFVIMRKDVGTIQTVTLPREMCLELHCLSSISWVRSYRTP